MISDADKALYARQILLSELGFEGQARLSGAELAIADGADPTVLEVASDYLRRAGVSVASQPSAAGLPLPTAADVQRVAGDRELETCAAWLLGAFAAVEVIKQTVGAGTPAALGSEFVLSREVV